MSDEEKKDFKRNCSRWETEAESQWDFGDSVQAHADTDKVVKAARARIKQTRGTCIGGLSAVHDFGQELTVNSVPFALSLSNRRSSSSQRRRQQTAGEVQSCREVRNTRQGMGHSYRSLP